MLEECVTHEIEVCFFDSVGLAISGNPGDFETVIDFFDETIADFVANGITPVLIDHQRRLANGERNQSLGAYGSVWKENLSRTQLQIELVTRDRDAHTVTTRLRAKKTNFDELPEPIEVKTTFTADAITLEVVATEDTDRATEETLSARDRVLCRHQCAGRGGTERDPGNMRDPHQRHGQERGEQAAQRGHRSGHGRDGAGWRQNRHRNRTRYRPTQ